MYLNLNKENPTVFERTYDWVVDKSNKFTESKNEKIYWEDVKNKFENAFRQDYQGNTDLKTRFDIITKGNKQYVKASRQVISGKNSLKWQQQVEDYINNSIRNGQDIQVLSADGDILTITEDTAGKAKFRNQIVDKNGNTRYLNNKEFLRKLTSETHIDELAKVFKQINKKPVPAYKNHSFAKDGWNYRRAYFEDFDGQYYEITMSVGKNGKINTIYNIGKLNEKNRSKPSLVAQRPSDKNITDNEGLTSTNSIPTSNNNVNTTNNNSMQESKNNSIKNRKKLQQINSKISYDKYDNMTNEEQLKIKKKNSLDVEL